MTDVYGWVYALCDDLGDIHYVGQSIEPTRRFRQHLSSAAAGTSRNKWLERWILSLDGAPTLRLIAQAATAAELDDVERWTIAELRRLDAPLTNIRDGGDRFLVQRQYTRTEQCSVDGCERVDIAQSDPALCFTCYKRIRENGGVDPGFRASKQTSCSVESCTNPHGAKIVHGLCPKHLARLKRNGDPLISKRRYHDRRAGGHPVRRSV